MSQRESEEREHERVEQPSNLISLDPDDGARVEDHFRRATFGWAVATKRMVESSAHLTRTTRVPPTALEDIEWAKDLLDTLFVPDRVKPPGLPEGHEPVTATEVQESVSKLSWRMTDWAAIQEHVDNIVEAPPILRTPPPKEPQPISIAPTKGRGPLVNMNEKADPSPWNAPVWPKGDKMLWAGLDCPSCSSVAGQRCQRADGAFMEKPHRDRKSLAEAA